MKLLIKETNWWGLHKPGEKKTDYEYDLDDMKNGDKVIVSTTKVMHSGSDLYVDEPNLYFIFVSKDSDSVKLKIGSHRWFNGKNFSKKPLVYTIRVEKPLILNEDSMDAGYIYSLSLKKQADQGLGKIGAHCQIKFSGRGVK